MKTCPLQTLRLHSSGDKYQIIKNTPEAGGGYRLQNSAGAILCGYRGGVYRFASPENAREWLTGNLAKVSKGIPTGQAHIERLVGIQLSIRADFLQAELQAIADRNAGLWQAIPDVAVNGVENVDGGAASSNFIFSDGVNYGDANTTTA